MVLNKVIEGKFVNLRSVKEEDAELILRLRNDPEISRYLPPLKITTDQQRNWIANQRIDNDSFYFIIEDKNNNPIGTISVYNIKGNHAESGRVCSIGDSIQNSEATLLHYDFIFNTLKLDFLEIWVYKENIHVLAYNKAFGCEWEGEKYDEKGESFLFGRITSNNFQNKSERIRKIIKSIKK